MFIALIDQLFFFFLRVKTPRLWIIINNSTLEPLFYAIKSGHLAPEQYEDLWTYSGFNCPFTTLRKYQHYWRMLHVLYFLYCTCSTNLTNVRKYNSVNSYNVSTQISFDQAQGPDPIHGTNKSDELKCSRPQGVFYQGILVAIAYLQILHWWGHGP